MNAREVYLSSATLFFAGWISYSTFERIYQLYDGGVSLDDPRWIVVLGECQQAERNIVSSALRGFESAADLFAAIEAKTVKVPSGPLYEVNQAKLAAELLKLNRGKN